MYVIVLLTDIIYSGNKTGGKKQIIENRNTDSTDSEILKEIDDKIIKSVKIHHKNKLEKEFNKLENTLKTKGKSSAVFQLKNTIVGNKIKSQEQAAIECPESKKVITDTDEIKSHTVNYCVNLLKSKPAHPDYIDLVKVKKQLHILRLQEKLTGEEDLSQEMFDEALHELRKTKKDKYRFITDAGNEFKKSLFNLFKLIWDKEQKPEQWRLDTLVQIHKKGSKLNLNNFRFIHMKDDIP